VIFASIQIVNLKLNQYTDPALRNNLGKYLKSMRQNCFRLIRLVNNLIDITRIDAGYYGLSLENQNIVSVVEDITLSVAEYMENKSISLIFDTEI
jgi:signal transduction histidine kinase